MTFTAFFLLAQAAPANGAQPNFLLQLMPLVFIFVIFYFLLIRPQQKRQKEHEKLVAAVKTGDRVVTNAGMHGVVANVKDKTILIKVADNVKIEFDRSAVVSVAKAAEGSEEGK